MAVAVEAKQVRQSHRVDIALPAAIMRQDGHLFSCTLRDYSDGGVGITLASGVELAAGDSVQLLLKQGVRDLSFPAKVMRSASQKVGLKLDNLNQEQHISFIQATFARADTWASWQEDFSRDQLMVSLKDVLLLGWSGFKRLPFYLPRPLRWLLMIPFRLLSWVASFMPRMPSISLYSSAYDVLRKP